MNFRKVWHFIWHEDSIWSWLVNIVLAFILIKFIVYPGLGFLLGTNFPIVAVVSSSMHHEGSFDSWWANASSQYADFDLSLDNVTAFPLRSGFNKGDIMILTSGKDAEIGDVIVFIAGRPDPIIHRVVRKYNIDEKVYFQTKGDNFQTNPRSLQQGGIDETEIPLQAVVGKAIFRIPLLGYIKILFVDLISLVS